MTYRTRLATAAVLSAATLVVAAPSQAEDQRPCVSRVEFRHVPGLTYVNGRTNPGKALTRHQLEEFWDVQGLGRIDHDLSGPASTLWVYPICAYSIHDARVWVVTTGRDGTANIAMRWYDPNTTPNGHQE